jgi:hypothetical protein
LEDKPGRGRRAVRFFKAYYHNRWPRRFRPLGILHWGSRTAMASSAPAVAYAFYDSITLVTAGAASAAIFVGHSMVSMFDAASKEKKSPVSDAGTETIIRLGELLGAAKPKSREDGIRNDAIRSALGVIEIFARQITGCEKNELSVSIALYTGSSDQQMTIRHRNPGNTRPINRKFDGRTALGHHACRAGRQPRVVHDLKGLSKGLQKSPTQSSASYRSFLLVPLVITKGGVETIGGYLSIDSDRPYCFYGRRASIIVVNIEPIVEHIQNLL